MITLKPEQEKVLNQAIKSGLAHTPEEALDQALDALRARLPHEEPVDESVAAAARGHSGNGMVFPWAV